MCGANGCSVDSAIAGGLPPCHDGGGAGSAAGLFCANAGAAKATAASVATSFMGNPPLGTAIKSLLRCRAQQARGGLPPLLFGNIQRGLAAVVARVALGAAREQKPDRLVLAEAGRPHEGGEVVVVARIDLRAVIQQGAKHLRMAVGRGVEDGGLLHPVD